MLVFARLHLNTETNVLEHLYLHMTSLCCFSPNNKQSSTSSNSSPLAAAAQPPPPQLRSTPDVELKRAMNLIQNQDWLDHYSFLLSQLSEPNKSCGPFLTKKVELILMTIINRGSESVIRQNLVFILSCIYIMMQHL